MSVAVVEQDTLSRKGIAADHHKRLVRLQKAMAAEMREFFAGQIEAIVSGVSGLTDLQLEPTKAARREPDAAATALVNAVFVPSEWDERLKETAARPLAQAMAEGAIAELFLHAAALESRGVAVEIAGKRTTAEIAADELNVPDGIATDFPDWLKQKIAVELTDIFAQPYWTKINQTTRDDVARTVDRGLRDGLSIRQIAKEIETKHGGTYTRARATAVARTELTDAMGAGHSLGIERLQDETGLELGKEWLSVLGPTTRDSHAALDGAQADEEGMFELAGYRIPWPAHRSLPVGLRANCQCTILSTFVGETTRDDSPEAEPVAEPKPPTQAELDAMPVMEALERATGLETKRQAVLSVGKGIAELQLARAELVRVHAELRDRRLEISWDDSPAAQAERADINKRLMTLSDEIRKLDGKIAKRTATVFRDALSAVALPKAERVAFRPTLHTAGLSETKDGKKVSTGKFSDEFKRKVKESLSFLQAITSNRGGAVSKAVASRNLRFHSTEPLVRAFQRGDGGSATKDETTWGVFLDEKDGVNVFAHEVTHHLENTLPGAQRRANEFVAERIKRSGKPDVKLKDVLPSLGYDDSEVGNDDDFAKAFAGKQEDEAKNYAYYAGKRYARGDTEILTVGVERFIEDPVAFAFHDAEWFKFVLGVLDGTIQ